MSTRHKSLFSIFFVLLLLFSFAACSKSNQTADQTDEAVSQADVKGVEAEAETDVAANPYLFKLDGNFEDWQDIKPLWEEGGAEGHGVWGEHSIDIKQVYFKNDDQYLYVFMKCSPTLEERFKVDDSGGIVGDLYLDTDNDPSTGGTYILMWDSEKYKGYEVRVWIPLGYETRSGEKTMYVGYELYMAEGESFSGLGIFSQNTTKKGSLIAHGPDGIEMALPLNRLGIQIPAIVRVLLAENCNNGEEEGYDVATLKLE